MTDAHSFTITQYMTVYRYLYAIGVLPSIITDHADINSRDLKLVIPPKITHTDATPRGSPKSDIPSPHCDNHSILVSCCFLYFHLLKLILHR